MPGTGYFDDVMANGPSVPVPSDAIWGESEVGRLVKLGEKRKDTPEEVLRVLEGKNLSPGIRALINRAHELGKEPSEIVHYLRFGKDYDAKADEGLTSAFARGGNTAVMNTLGIIPDVLQSGMNAAVKGVGKLTGLYDYDPKTGPVGGSKFNRGVLNKLFEVAGANRKPTYESLEDLPPSMRPAAAAGETFAGSSLFSALPGAMALARPLPGTAAMAAPQLRNALDPILDTAAKNPATFGALETTANASAALGSATAEATDPNDKMSKMMWETAAVLANPTGRILKTGQAIKEGASTLFGRSSQGGREDAAIDLLRNQAEKHGEDLTELSAALARAAELGPSGTTAQVTGSPLVHGLEDALGRRESGFARHLSDIRNQHLTMLQEAYERLASSGNPDDLKMAAQVRTKIIDDKLRTRLEGAAAQAEEARLKAFGEDRTDIASASRQANKPIEEAVAALRAKETELWSAPNEGKDRIAQYTNLNDAVKKLKAALPRDESPPAEIDSFIKMLNAKGTKEKPTKPPTVGELMAKRSTLLDAARKARASDQGGLAGTYNDLADAILQDIDEAAIPGYDEAREFTRKFHDAFSRTFAGDALGRAKSGARDISPEMLLNRAFGSGKEAGAERFGQLENFGRYADELVPGSNFTGQTRSAQDRFIRIMAGSTLDKQTGKVNPKALATFVSNNAALLERFPELKADLVNAEKAENLFRYTEKRNAQAQKTLLQKAIFNNLMGVEDSSRVIGTALSGKNPVQSYGQMVQLARRTGKNAVEGLRSATLDAIYARATKGEGPVSFTTMNKMFHKPMSRGQPSLLDMMKTEGVLGKEEAENLDKLLAWGQVAELKGIASAEIDSLPGAIPDFIRNTIGIHLGHMVGAKGLGASTMQMSAQGQKLVNRFWVKMPGIGTKQVLKQFVEDPTFARYLLNKPHVQGAPGAIETISNAWEEASKAWLKKQGLPGKLIGSTMAAIRSLPASQWQQANGWLMDMGLNWPNPPDEPMPGYLSGDTLPVTLDLGEGLQKYSIPLVVNGEKLNPDAAIQRFLTANNPPNGIPQLDETGLVVKGNIKPFSKETLYHTIKGSTVTGVGSLTVGTDKGFVLIPTIVGDKELTNAEAKAHFKKTGQNLGTFESEAAAARYGKELGEAQIAYIAQQDKNTLQQFNTPPVKGAKLAPDGKWYLADPKRPGKYLLVTARK